MNRRRHSYMGSYMATIRNRKKQHQEIKNNNNNRYAPTEFFAMSRVDLEKTLGKRQGALKRVRSNIEVLETSRGLTGVSFVIDPKLQDKISDTMEQEVGTYKDQMDRSTRVSVARSVTKMFSDVSIVSAVGRSTKTTRTGLPIGLAAQVESEHEEKIEKETESETEDDDDVEKKDEKEDSAGVSSAVSDRLDRIEDMLESLLSISKTKN